MESRVPFKIWVLRIIVFPLVAIAWVIDKLTGGRLIDWLRENGGWGD